MEILVLFVSSLCLPSTYTTELGITSKSVVFKELTLTIPGEESSDQCYYPEVTTNFGSINPENPAHSDDTTGTEIIYGAPYAHNCSTNCVVKLRAGLNRTHSVARRSAIPDAKDIPQTGRRALSSQDDPPGPTLPYMGAGSSPQMKSNPAPITMHTCKSIYQYNYVSATEYPYFVTIDVRNGNWPLDRPCPDYRIPDRYSKGVIVSRNYVLWAGFVCPRICTYIVIVGSDELRNGSDLHRAEVIPYYEDWRDRPVGYIDESEYVVLLKLYEPIIFGVGVQPVKLSDIGEQLNFVKSGIIVHKKRSDSRFVQYKESVLFPRDCNDLRDNFHYRPIVPVVDYTRSTVEIFCLIDAYDQCDHIIDGMFFMGGKLFGIPYKTMVMPSTGTGFISYVVMHDISHYRNFIKNHTGV
ncbi:hypothetical protein QAD02_023854 [Eretmocerus hayati]|uniref:Uncharacterized protein n=1 Tax=Eretmocerus hayati TaxID=131215 RepID=A0ACC2PWS6_9HYME|nr:hypothetical protein QAD02_023854 [Eretmocerus hayati]